MRYPYLCPHCHNDFEVIKPVSEYEKEEFCEKCGTKANSYIGRVYFYGEKDWGKEEYNPAFGCVVKSKAHQKELLRKFVDQGKVFEEVGNEPVDKIHSYFDKQREEKKQKRWEEADRVKLYD